MGAILTDRFGGMLVQTPLHYLLVWLTIQPVDPASSAVLVRLPSAVMGALTPLVVYGLGKETFGRAQGLLAALLIAISAVHIGHSQDVRPYTFLVFLSALSIYFLLKAERTGQTKWWVLFTLVTVLDLHFSYFALTLFLPALGLYLSWLVYKAWKQQDKVELRNVLLSLAVIALASIPLLLDLLQIHRTAPNWGIFFDIVGRQVALLPARLAQLGISGSTEEAIQWGFAMLAVVGAIAAVRKRQWKEVVLCTLMILVPALLLAAFRTTNIVFQRYALFAMPFYFLLLANGVVFMWRGGRTWKSKRLTQAFAGAAATLLVVLLAYSTFLYLSPEQHRRLSFLADYRGVARYLSRQATPEDLVVLVDEPALGVAVVDFYWHDRRPATVLDARDPRLFTAKPAGSIYWVVSFFQNNPEFTEGLSVPGQGWASAKQFERIVVLEERGSTSTLSGMERLVGKMERLLPDHQPVRTLRGGILQAQGDVAGAAEAYRSAGAYYPQLGEEFLATANGFADRGQQDRAWREAITSKFMRPGNPDVHIRLADYLDKMGAAAEAAQERRIADALASR